MSDLVKRLRSVQQLGYRTDIGQTCREAADRIEELERIAAEEKTRAMHAEARVGVLTKYSNAQLAAIDRLDAALCNFLNGFGDDEAAQSQSPWLRKMLDEVGDAYEQCHMTKVMDLRRTATEQASD